MSNAILPPNLRARVVPIIKILDGSVSEPIEGKSGRVYGTSGQPDNHERCSVFPHKQTSPHDLEIWLKDVEGGALDDIFQVPFRRFGAYVPSFRLEVIEVSGTSTAPGPEVPEGTPPLDVSQMPCNNALTEESTDAGWKPVTEDAVPYQEWTPSNDSSVTDVPADASGVPQVAENVVQEPPRRPGRPPKAK